LEGRCCDRTDLSGEDGIEDAGVESDEIEVKDCDELLLVEREDDEEFESTEELEPCRESGRSGVVFNEGFGKRARAS
jgi:hypothetical protein